VVREALERYVADNRTAHDATLSFIGIGQGTDPTVAENHEELLWQK